MFPFPSAENHPCFYPLLLLIVGIVAGEAACVRWPMLFCSGCFPWILAGALLVVLLLWGGLLLMGAFIRSWWPGFRFFIIHCVVWLMVGVTLIARTNDASSLQWPDNPLVAQAVVTDAVRVTEHSVRCEVQLLVLGDSLASARPDNRRVILSLAPIDSAVALCPGDVVYFAADIRRPTNRGNPYEFDYASYLRRQGISGVTSRVPAGRWCRQPSTSVADGRLPLSASLRIHALRVRGRLTDCYRRAGLSGDGLAVVSALTLGDKSVLTPELRSVYEQAGASHLLALSGLHLGVLLVLMQWFLLRPLRHSRFYFPCVLFALLFIWGYVWLAGLPASLVRASVMYSLFLVTTLMSRQTLTVNNLLVTMLLLLLYRPHYLFEVGFQLSCLAMFGLLLMAPHVERFCVGCPWWFSVPLRMFAAAFSAQLFTAPLVARYFHLFTPWSSLASLPSIPITTLLVGASPFLLLTGWLFPAFVWPARVIGMLVKVQHAWLTWSASWPAAQWNGLYPSWGMVAVLYASLLMGLAVCVFGNIRRSVVVVMSLFLVAVAFVCDRHIGREQACVWFYNLPSCPVVHVVYSPSSSLLLTTQPDSVFHHTRYVERDYWRRRLNNPPQLVDVHSCTTLQAIAYAGWVQLPGLTMWFLDGSSDYAGTGYASPDYLYVTRQYRGNLSRLALTVRPGCVVLDASLGTRRARRYAAVCRSMGWKCHDLASQGALKVAFK